MTKRTIIPIGPYHALQEEPEFFKLHVEGERRSSHLDIEIGYNHRGIEKLSESKDFEETIFLVERICGICSTSHPIACVQAIEEAGEIEVPERALLHPIGDRRTGADSLASSVARVGRALPRFQHHLDVGVAVPRGCARDPGADHRQPKPLRHDEAWRRAPGHSAGKTSPRSGRCSRGLRAQSRCSVEPSWTIPFYMRAPKGSAS